MSIKERTIECDAVEHDIDDAILFLVEHGNDNPLQFIVKIGSGLPESSQWQALQGKGLISKTCSYRSRGLYHRMI
jgi:hypothetical protein